jgi:hypothetical protein
VTTGPLSGRRSAMKLALSWQRYNLVLHTSLLQSYNSCLGLKATTGRAPKTLWGLQSIVCAMLQPHDNEPVKIGKTTASRPRFGSMFISSQLPDRVTLISVIEGYSIGGWV